MGKNNREECAVDGEVMAEHIGKSLYVLRMRNGWSKRKLARELGVSCPTVSRWENGDGSPLDYNFHKIRDLLIKEK